MQFELREYKDLVSYLFDYDLIHLIQLLHLYPNGVCIRKDIHDLFHREYGTVVTPDMWNDFVDNYKKGKYII